MKEVSSNSVLMYPEVNIIGKGLVLSQMMKCHEYLCVC